MTSATNENIPPTSRSPESIGLPQGIYEVFLTLGNWRLWGTIALDDIVGRYRRTTLGPLWITAGQAGFMGGLYLLRSKFSSGHTNYLEYLAVSLPSWGFLIACMVDGSSAFLRAKGLIESYPIPLALYCVRTVAAALINYAHLMIVFVVVALIQWQLPGAPALALVPGLGLAVAFGLGAALLLATLGARFHDLAPGLTLATSVLFVLTPVFWVAAPTQDATPMLRLNPLYYLLEVIRVPLLGHWPSMHIWAGAVLVASFTLFAGVVVYSRMRQNTVYYL